MATRAALSQVFAEETMCPSHTRRWFQSFRNGQTSLVDIQRASRKKSAWTPANVQAVRNMVSMDKSITFSAIMMQTGLKQTTVHWIIKKDLNLTLEECQTAPGLSHTPAHCGEISACLQDVEHYPQDSFKAQKNCHNG